MYSHLISFAFKALKKQKMYVAISMVGMSVALGASLLILSYAGHELSSESCHQNAARIFRVGGDRTEGDRISYLASAMFPLGPDLKEAVPGVAEQVRLRKWTDVVVRTDGRLECTEARFLFADPSVFSVFTIPLVQGDPHSVLSRPASVVISERVAGALFAGSTPVGETITIQDSIQLTITGVMEDLPNNTQMHTDFLASLATLERLGETLNSWDDPETFNAYTYLLLSEGVKPETVDAAIPGVLAAHLGDESPAYSLHPQSLEDLYFTSHLSDELGPTGSLNDVYLLIGIGLLLVLMACVNYVNLATAWMFRRSREFLTRSVAGANRRQLLAQLLIESLLLTSASMLIGLVIHELSIPYLEAFVGKSLDVSLSQSPWVWMTAPLLVLTVGVVAGGYPAALVARQWPGGVVSHRLTAGPGKSRLRRILVVSQAFVAIGLAGFTVGVRQQLNFVDEFDYGFRPQNVWVLRFDDDPTPGQKEQLKRELQSLGVGRSTLAASAPGESVFRITTARLPGQSEDEFKVLNTFTGDADFCAAFGFELVRGDWLPDETRSGGAHSAVVSEAAVRQLGLTEPIGAELITSRGPLTIVGVVRDLYALSLHNPVMPSLITRSSSPSEILALNLPEGMTGGLMAEITKRWDGIFSSTPFDCRPLTGIMGDGYAKERKLVTLCSVATILAIVIATLGLLGLTSFIVERRLREVGIRKSLGASLTSIVRLLTGEFVLMVGLAGVIAWLPTRYAMNRWLETYAYRVDFGWITFSIVVAAVVMLTVLTMGIKVIKVANANPADTLRVE